MEEMKHGIFEAREALDDTVLSLDALRDTEDPDGEERILNLIRIFGKD